MPSILNFENKLDNEFNKLSLEDQKNMNEYRKKILELKEQNRNEKVKAESSETQFSKLGDRLKEKK